LPRRAANFPALPDGAPSKVASRASDALVAVFGGVHNGKVRLTTRTCVVPCYSGSSGSRRVLRFAVADGEDVERTKLQRIDGA